MKAFVASPQGAVAAEVPMPRPKPNEVLVKVHACGLNRADLGMASGHAHGARGGAGTVVGMEWAGEVVECGRDVQGVRVGDKVMCSGGGGFAEYAVTDMGRAMPFPDAKLAMTKAASLPVALQTMHDAVVTNGRLIPGEAVLIQGASSGVGLMAMQIAKLKGARLVIGTSTNAERRARLSEFGADLSLDPRDDRWVEQVLAATQGQGVDLIVDQVSGATMNQNMRATRVLGRIVNVGRLGGNRAEFDFDLHALRRISYIGVTFRTRSTEEIRSITGAVRHDLWEDVAAGRLSLPIDEIFSFDQTPQALAHMAANKHLGKIVVQVI